MRLLLFAVLLLAGCSKPSSVPNEVKPAPALSATGELEVTPVNPKSKEPVTVKMTVKDRNGKPIENANVRATFTMTMGDSEMQETLDLKWDGKQYAASKVLPMAGRWRIAVEARDANGLLLNMPSEVTVR